MLIAKQIEHALAATTAAAAFEKLDAAGVPCEISSPDFGRDMWEDPLAREEQWVARVPHRMVGEMGQVGLAVTLSETPTRIQGAPVPSRVLSKICYNYVEYRAI